MHFIHKQIRALFPVFLVAVVFCTPHLFAHAQFNTDTEGGGNPFNTSTDGSGNPFNTNTNGGSTFLQNPLAVDSFCELIKVVLNAALVIGIPIAVLFIVWAGFKFILARGNPSGLAEARTNFFHTLIGVAIFVGASLIATIIINTLVQLGASNISSC